VESIVKEFQFAVKETAPCVAEITVTAGPETTAKYCRAARMEYGKQVKVPGFRPGKIPAKILEAQFGPGIRAAAQEQLIRKSADAALKELKHETTRDTSIASRTPDLLEEGKEFQYVIKTEYYPEITLPDLKTITTTLEAVSVSDEEVDNTIKEWLQYRSKLEKQDRAAQAEDLLQVNYTCDAPEEFQAESFKGNHLVKAEKTWLILRQPEMLPGATAALAGASAGESKDFAVTFPEDHYIEDLRGKTFNYHVEVLEVHGYIVPELTDELAKEAGAENAEDMHKKVRENLEATKKNGAEEKCKNEILDKLAEALADTPLPPGLVALTKQNCLDNLAKQKENAEKSAEEKEAMAAKEANKIVLQDLIVMQLQKDHKDKISVSPEEFMNTMEYLAGRERINVETLLNRLKGTGRLESINFNLIFAKAMTFLFENANVQKA
jgi:trigger factor